jgi:superfamily II DNA/RNA helicase
MPRTLILEPTRELAAQVKEQFDKYGAGQKLNVALLIGGVSFGDQDMKLTRGVDVLIATPGRLLDHTERGGLLLTGVELLVIDEADRMLDMGFIPDIERICKLVPFTRQTLFFTATMPNEIRRVTDTFLHNPEKVEVSRPATTAATVAQSQVSCGREPHEKRELLRRLLREAQDLKNAIIFCNRKRDVAIVCKSLQKHGFSVGALHGDMDQSARTASLDQFRKGELPLLVASDVAARGLDIPEVSHVLNFDVPYHPDDYVHRIGRTGRAGRTGTAITIVCPADFKSLAAIEKLTGQTIPKADIKADLPGYGAGASEADANSETTAISRPARSRQARDKSGETFARGGKREGRKPRRSGGDHQRHEAPAATAGAAMAAPQPPSIGRAPAPRREAISEPGDHSHLPAFLLRPIRARG